MKFSIIIPHKNCPDLLQRLLNSIPQREDIEVIVVDDDSSSDKVDFNNFPSGKALYTTIFTQEGKGAGYARNIGMTNAQGEWIIFADADDYFYTDNLNRLLDNITDTNDVVLYGSRWVHVDGTEHYYPYDLTQPDDQHIKPCTDLTLLYMWYVTPWIKMYRRQFLINNNITFEEVRYSNDEMFSTRVALATKTFGRTDLLVYHYEQTANSLTEDRRLDNYLVRWNVYARKERLLRKHGLTAQWEPWANIYEIYTLAGYRTFLLCGIKMFHCLGLKRGWQGYTRACRVVGISLVPYLTPAKRWVKKHIFHK